MYTWRKCRFHGTSAGKRRLKMIESYKPNYWQQKCMRISWQWKNICHTKPIQLVCEVGRKTCFFISISPVSYFEANGQNQIHFRLIQVLKKTSNRTAENLPQRKLWAAHDARSQRGLWSHRTSEGVLLRKRQIFALSSSDPINYEVRLLRISEWLICISLSLQ